MTNDNLKGIGTFTELLIKSAILVAKEQLPLNLAKKKCFLAIFQLLTEISNTDEPTNMNYTTSLARKVSSCEKIVFRECRIICWEHSPRKLQILKVI